MEAYHIAAGQLDTPKCFKSEGTTPEQIMEIDLSIDIEPTKEEMDYEDDFDFMDDHMSYEELSDDHFNDKDYHDNY